MNMEMRDKRYDSVTVKTCATIERKAAYGCTDEDVNVTVFCMAAASAAVQGQYAVNFRNI